MLAATSGTISAMQPHPPLHRSRWLLATGLLALATLLLVGGAPRSAHADDAEPPPPPRPTRWVPAGTGAGQSGHAGLAVDRLEHSYGVVKQHGTYKTTIHYRNDSSSPIDKITVRPGCGCISAEVSHKRLAPGEIGTLEISWHTTTMSGKSVKKVELHNRDRTQGLARIRLEVEIVGGLVVSPGSVAFGDVRVGSRPTALIQLRWMPGQGEPFQITEASTPGTDLFEVTRTDLSEHPDGWKGYQLAITARQPLTLGMISSQLLVRTTHPERKRIVIPIQGNVCGAVWLQSHTLDFSMMSRGRPRTLRIRFRPFDEAQRFGTVRAHSPQGVVQVKVRHMPRLANGQWWTLEATVPADAPAGSLEGHQVVLDTGIPGEPKTVMPVRGRVRDRSERGR